jgi:hypothetical protein
MKTTKFLRYVSLVAIILFSALLGDALSASDTTFRIFSVFQGV